MQSMEELIHADCNLTDVLKRNMDIQARQGRVTVKKMGDEEFYHLCPLYPHVSFKEQKQPHVGVKPEADGRAAFHPMSNFLSLSHCFSLSLSLSQSCMPFINHPCLVGQRAWC